MEPATAGTGSAIGIGVMPGDVLPGGVLSGDITPGDDARCDFGLASLTLQPLDSPDRAGQGKVTQAGVKVRRPEPVDVTAVRGRLGFTQAQFAARFGVSVATLRHWQRGDRNPQGTALVLPNLIDSDPAEVLRALS